MKFRSVNDGVPSDNFERDAVEYLSVCIATVEIFAPTTDGRCSELSRGGVGSL